MEATSVVSKTPTTIENAQFNVYKSSGARDIDWWQPIVCLIPKYDFD